MPLINDGYPVQPNPHYVAIPERAQSPIDMTLTRARELSKEMLGEFSNVLEATQQGKVQLAIERIDLLAGKELAFETEVEKIQKQLPALKESGSEQTKVVPLARILLQLNQQMRQFRDLPTLKARLTRV